MVVPHDPDRDDAEFVTQNEEPSFRLNIRPYLWVQEHHDYVKADVCDRCLSELVRTSQMQ